MSKLKKILNISFTTLSAGLLLAGCFSFLNLNNNTVSKADTQKTITNVVPEFFNATINNDLISNQETPIALVKEGASSVNLKFDTTKTVVGDGETIWTVQETKKVGLSIIRTSFYSNEQDGSGILFYQTEVADTSLTLKEGGVIAVGSDVTLNRGVQVECQIVDKDGKVHSLFAHQEFTPVNQLWTVFKFDGFSYNLNGEEQSYTNKDGSSADTSGIIKTDQAGEVQYPEGLTGQSFDLNVKLETTENAESNVILEDEDKKPTNTIQVTEEGLYEFNITYTPYKIKAENGQFVFVEEESGVQQNINFEFFLFDQSTYLSGKRPNLTPSHFKKSSNIENDSYNYFYNFTDPSNENNQLPSLEYDLEKYDLKITKLFAEKESVLNLNYDMLLEKQEDGVVFGESEEILNNDVVKVERIYETIDEQKVPSSRIKLYFNDLGEYKIEISAKYIIDKSTGEELSFDRYSLPIDINPQFVHMYGLQSTINSNPRSEFKSINDNQEITESADITKKVEEYLNDLDTPSTLEDKEWGNVKGSVLKYLNDDETLPPVSTNQAPVKFLNNSKIAEDGAMLFKVTGNAGSLTIDEGEKISPAKSVSEAGVYLAVFKYSFDELTDANGNPDSTTDFQIFYFETNNQTPSLQVAQKVGGEYNVVEDSGFFTNEEVFVKKPNAESLFDSDVSVRITQMNFNEEIIQQKTLLEKDFSYENEYCKFSENGIYTVELFKSDNTLATRKKFVIDKTPVENFESYSVVQNGNYFNLSNKLNQVFTNQSFIFSWKEEKSSGARVWADYKFYPMDETKKDYTTNDIMSFLNPLINSVPVEYSIDLSKPQNWLPVENGYSNIQNNSIINKIVNKTQGLYVMHIYDEAGNGTTEFVFVDKSAPRFVCMQKLSGGGTEYSFLNPSETLNKDSTIVWGESKIFEYVAPNEDFLKDSKGEPISSTNKSLVELMDYTEIINSSTWFRIPINEVSYIKRINEENYTKTQNETQTEIRSFYKLFFKNVDGVSKYYVSTTTDDYYLPIEPDFTDKNTKEEKDKEIKAAVQKAVEQGVATVHFSEGDIEEYANQDEKNLATVYSVEGSYIFLIADASNTQIATGEKEKESYLNYNSAYQIINLTVDSSLLQVGFGSEEDFNSLIMADHVLKESKDDNGLRTREAFYQPTACEKPLEISFIPTVKKETKFVQVDSVQVEFYPFVTKNSSIFNPSRNGIETVLYRDLAEDPIIIPIYSYDESTQDFDTKTIDLNIVNGMTQEGKYVITRTYKTPADDNDFVVDEFDFHTRVFNLIVDRQNVLSEPVPVSIQTKNWEIEDEEIKISATNNILSSNINLLADKYEFKVFYDGVDDGVVNPEFNHHDGEKYIYVYDKNIEKISLYDNISYQTLIEKETEPTLVPIISSQSIVGQGIFVSVFAGKENSVEFPTFLNGLNDASTLYTGVQDGGEINPVFTTNKKNVKIYVPEYKYTLQNTQNESGFTSLKNSDLSNFYETESISHLKLTAEVFKDGILKEEGVVKTATNGFLDLGELSEAGVYKVVLTQAYNEANFGQGNEKNPISFKKSYSFAFVIEDPEVKFDVQANGKMLEGYVENDQTNLFTNQKEIEIKWEDSKSQLFANIDRKKIAIKIANDAFDFAGEEFQSLTIEENIVKLEGEEVGKYSINDIYNTLTLNLEEIGAYQNQNQIQIKMNLENDLGSLTKTVKIDTSAFDMIKVENKESFSSSVSSLIELTENEFSNLKEKDLRKFYDSSGVELNVETVDKSKVAFTQTISDSSRNKNFAYSVNVDFFEELLEKTKNSNTFGLKQVHYKQINPYSPGFFETTFTDFAKNTFIRLDEGYSFGTDQFNMFYQVVESDYAGNLNIYIVHLYDDQAQNISFTDEQNTQNTNPQKISKAQIESNKYTLYGSTETVLNEVFINNDPWTIFTIEDTTYMRSPWLASEVLRMSGEVVKVEDLLKNINKTNADSKKEMLIFERNTAKEYNLNIALSNTASLKTGNLSQADGENVLKEGISIELPNVFGNLIEAYPVKITVSVQEGDTEEEKASLENNPLTAVNLSDPNYSFENSWNQAIEDIRFSVNAGVLSVLFTEEVLADFENDKIKYEIVDNFGRKTEITHIAGAEYDEKFDYENSNVYEYEDSGEIYIATSDKISYSYNENIYSVEIYSDDADVTSSSGKGVSSSDTEDYKTFTFTCEKGFDKVFEIRVARDDDEDNVVKTYLVHLYDKLPTFKTDDATDRNPFVNFTNQNGNQVDFKNSTEQVYIDGKKYQLSFDQETFSSRMHITHTDPSSLKIPFVQRIFAVGEDGIIQEIENTNLIQNAGIYYFLYEYKTEIKDINNKQPIFNVEYVLGRLKITDPQSSYYSVRKNTDGKWEEVERSEKPFINIADGVEYSNYYIINTDVSNVEIVTNEAQNVTKTQEEEVNPGNPDIRTFIYTLSNHGGGSGINPYEDQIVISYISKTSKFISTLKYKTQLEEEDVKTGENVLKVWASEEDEGKTTSLEIQFNSYNGILQNKAEIIVKKDGFVVELPVEEINESLSKITLKISGTYHITFKDKAGNVQMFGNRDFFEIIFLKDVHFTMTYLDENNQEVETEAIDKGIFNKQLKLNIKNSSKYYTTASLENMIEVTRNGKPYSISGKIVQEEDAYLFDQVGYYTVKFKATAETLNKTLYQETYSFTINNPNESRFAFILNLGEERDITNIVFNNGLSIEEKDGFDSKNLSLNYTAHSAENEVAGLWTITVDTNENLTIGDTENTTKYTFSVLIRSNIPPIVVSAPEGSTSTDVIEISFNAENLVNEVGDCLFIINDHSTLITVENAKEMGIVSHKIQTAGTYLIQVKTESGNLLYSYMIHKKDPMNTWTIIAIVLGSLFAIGIVVIVVLMRKRIRIR